MTHACIKRTHSRYTGLPRTVAATAVRTVTFGGDPAGVSSRYAKNAAGWAVSGHSTAGFEWSWKVYFWVSQIGTSETLCGHLRAMCVQIFEEFGAFRLYPEYQSGHFRISICAVFENLVRIFRWKSILMVCLQALSCCAHEIVEDISVTGVSEAILWIFYRFHFFAYFSMTCGERAI